MEYGILSLMTDWDIWNYSTRYRELVGTAETIVEMNKDIQDVDTILVDIGRRCNPRLVEKKHQHARQMKRDATEKGMLRWICHVYQHR